MWRECGAVPARQLSNNHTTFHNLRLWLTALFVLFAVSLSAITVWSVLDSYHRVLNDAGQQATRLARSLEEHVSRTMASSGQAMQPVIDLAEQRGGVEFLPEAEIHVLMRDRIAATPQIRGIIAIKPNGLIHAHGLIYPMKKVSLADRDYFQLHIQDSSLEYLLSRPLASRTDGKLLIPMTRRINLRDGAFGGLILAGLEPEYFLRFYSSLEMPEGSIIALLNHQGRELLRFPAAADQSQEGVPLSQLRALSSSGGIHADTTLLGHHDRLYTVREASALNVYVIVGISRASALAGWEHEKNVRIGLLLLAMLALAALYILALRQLRRAQESDKQLALAQFAVDQSPDFVLWVRQDLNIAYANAVVGDRLRVLREDLLQRPIAASGLLPEGVDWEQVLSRTDRQLRIQFETALQPQRGEPIPVEMVVNRLQFGSETYYCLAARDISERRRVEAELRRHRDHLQQMVDERTAELRAIFAATPLAILMTVDDQVRLVNPALEQMFGRCSREVVGRSIEALFSDFSSARRYRDALHLALVDGQIYSNEVLFRRQSGSVFWAHVHCRAIDPSNPMAGTISVIEDISSRRAAEQLLKQSEELNRTVIETCADGFVLFDAQLRLQLVNPALRVMLGCDQQTFVERYSANELLALPQGIEHGEVMLQWLRHADNGVEIELCSRAGLSVPVLVNRTPIWDERGELRYIFAFYTNIAQQKAIEHALTRAKEAAEAANLAKSSFLASMSHELRTPMHAILSYSDLGLEKSEGEEQEKLRRYYQRINVSGKRLLGLINDLLDLAKLEAGKMSYELAPHNLQVLVDDALAEIRPLMESRQLRLQFQPDERSISLICDRNRILQVLVNLLGNAVKFTPPGMCIYLGFLHDEPMRGGGIGSGIRLRDEGPGIASDELESIFEKFIQGSSTHKQGGTGLGLAICRDIVRDHGGEVYASNDAAGGAVFTLLLPCEN